MRLSLIPVRYSEHLAEAVNAVVGVELNGIVGAMSINEPDLQSVITVPLLSMVPIFSSVAFLSSLFIKLSTFRRFT